MCLMGRLDSSPVTVIDLNLWLKKDPTLFKVLNYVLRSWPEDVTVEAQKPFFRRKDELSVHDEVIL